jgi:membrane peptidoglycan carboxypeptidase
MAVALVYIAAALLPLMMVGIASTNVAVKAWDSLPVEVPDVNAVAQHSQLLDRNGKVFATFATTNRVPIKRNDLPDSMVNAIVSVEDADFFQHAGVDLKSIARAVFNNASGGSTQGGSTITQQWVKNVLANTATTDTAVQAAVERSWERKLREAKLALTADGGAFTKDDILTSYLNTAYFGDQAYGIFAAAKHYYSRHPRDLSLNQAAMLAGLVKSPSSLAPTQHKKAAIERRNTVLQRMQAEGYISEEKLAKEQARPIRLRLSQPDSGCINSRFPHYCSYTKAALLRDPVLGDTPERRQDVFDRGGLQVTTALDPTAQKASIDAARNHVGTSGDVAAAIAVVRPGTTEVVAAATNSEFGNGDVVTEITYAYTSLATLGSYF